MKIQRQPLLLLLLLLAGACGVGAEAEMPHFDVDLDMEDPGEMWAKPVRTLLASRAWDDSFGPVFADIRETYTLGGCDDACVRLVAGAFAARFPAQYKELRGIADAFAAWGHNVSVTELASYQYYYEIGHTRPPRRISPGCTSVVACGGDGRLWHGRNLDFHSGPYRNITAQVTWRRGGETLFESTQFVAEDVGVATGVRAGRFSFSYNWRASREPLQQVLDCIRDPSAAAPLGSVVRELFERGATFEEAASVLERSRTCGPAYVIVAGLNGTQGAVFTRNQSQSLHPSWIESCDAAAAAAAGRWYVAQANSDWWLPQPPADDRRDLAIGTLLALGQEAAASMQGMWAVLSTPGNSTCKGVLNADTIYTAVLRPATGEIATALR